MGALSNGQRQSADDDLDPRSRSSWAASAASSTNRRALLALAVCVLAGAMLVQRNATPKLDALQSTGGWSGRAGAWGERGGSGEGGRRAGGGGGGVGGGGLPSWAPPPTPPGPGGIGRGGVGGGAGGGGGGRHVKDSMAEGFVSQVRAQLGRRQRDRVLY